MSQPVKKKKIIRRRKSKGPGTQYFGPPEDAAIQEFQKSTDRREREKLYVHIILPAFDKLVENLIFIHEFYRYHDSYETLKNDCVEFLYETIYKWDASRGKKAFSYFNVVAKNWLIIQAKKRIKHLRRTVSITDQRSMASYEIEMIQNFKVIPSPDSMTSQAERMETIFKCLEEIKKNVTNHNEILCIEAIIQIFSCMDDLDFFNKRAVFLYLREISGLTPKQLTAAISSIKKSYREIRGTDGFEIF